MKAKITNSLNQNAMPTWRFGTLMAILIVLVLNTTTFAQNGQYVLGHPYIGLTTGTTDEFETGKTPFQCDKKDTRNQYLYLGSELLDQFATTGNITSLAFNVTALPSIVNGLLGLDTKLYNVSIRLGLVNTTALTGAIEPTVEYLFIPVLDITQTGWVTFNLVSAAHPLGFYWPGSTSTYNNIVVEICQHSVKPGGYPSSYPPNFEVRTSTFKSPYIVNNNYFSTDNALVPPFATDGCSMGPGTPGTSTTSAADRVRPDVRFTFACHSTSGPAGIPAPTTALNKCIGDINVLEVPTGDNHSGLTYQWQSSTNGTVFNDILGANAATYNAVKADVDMWYRRYSSCGAFGGIVSSAYPIYQKTWTGTEWKTGPVTTTLNPSDYNESIVFKGNWDKPASLRACSIVVKSGTVNIQSTRRVELKNEVKVNGGSLTFNNNSYLMQLNAAAANDGDIIYKRNANLLLRYDYTYWSSPVKDLKLNVFSPDTRVDKYYSWKHDSDPQEWLQESPTAEMIEGKGYIIRAPDNFPISGIPQPWTGSFIGTPNNGNVTVEVSGTTVPLEEKWNLIGNPYPSSLDAITFFNNNSTVLDGTFYLWTHNSAPSTLYPGTYTYNYNPNDYASFNKTGPSTWVGTPAGSAGNTTVPTRFIASGQSFMIKGIVDGVSNVTFANKQRYTNTANFYKFNDNAMAKTGDDVIDGDDAIVDDDDDDLEEEVDKSRFWLEYINENGGFKQLLVGYLDGATENYDNGYDGDIMGGDGVTFFSIIKDHQLSIQGKGLPFDTADTIPLGFTATVEGNNIIALVNYDGFFDNQEVYLEDTYLNVIHNLKESNYTFVANVGTFLDRFVLRYTENSLNLNSIPLSANSIIAFNKSGNLVVNAGINNIQSVKVYDLSGRLVLQKNDCQSPNVVFEKPNWNAQLMLVKVITEDKVEVTRKVLF